MLNVVVFILTHRLLLLLLLPAPENNVVHLWWCFVVGVLASVVIVEAVEKVALASASTLALDGRTSLAEAPIIIHYELFPHITCHNMQEVQEKQF